MNFNSPKNNLIKTIPYDEGGNLLQPICIHKTKSAICVLFFSSNIHYLKSMITMSSFNYPFEKNVNFLWVIEIQIKLKSVCKATWLGKNSIRNQFRLSISTESVADLSNLTFFNDKGVSLTRRWSSNNNVIPLSKPGTKTFDKTMAYLPLILFQNDVYRW